MKYRTKVLLGISIVAALFICGMVALLAIPGVTGTGGGGNVEIEDCDAEDMRNREKECGFVQPAKTTKPAPAKTPAKPNIRSTRR